MYKGLCRSSGYTTDGNYIWYVGVNNEIIQVDINTGKLECIGIVPGMYSRTYAYRIPIYYEKALYLLPYNTDRLCIYTLREREWSFIDFPDGIFMDSETERKLFGYVMTEYNLVFYGIHPVVVVLNLKANTYKSYRIDIEDTKRKGISSVNFWRDGIGYGDNIIVPVDYSNCFFEINIKKESTRLIMTGNQCILSPFQMVRRYKNKIYRVISDEKWNISVLVSDINNLYMQDELCQFYVEHEGIPTKEQTPFLYGEIMEEHLYLLPAYQEKIYIIDLNNGNVEFFYDRDINMESENTEGKLFVRSYFSGTLINIHTLASINETKMKLILFSGKDKTEKAIDLNMDELNYAKYKREVICAKYSINEDIDFTLDDFLKYL